MGIWKDDNLPPPSSTGQELTVSSPLKTSVFHLHGVPGDVCVGQPQPERGDGPPVVEVGGLAGSRRRRRGRVRRRGRLSLTRPGPLALPPDLPAVLLLRSLLVRVLLLGAPFVLGQEDVKVFPAPGHRPPAGQRVSLDPPRPGRATLGALPSHRAIRTSASRETPDAVEIQKEL